MLTNELLSEHPTWGTIMGY